MFRIYRRIQKIRQKKVKWTKRFHNIDKGIKGLISILNLLAGVYGIYTMIEPHLKGKA